MAENVAKKLEGSESSDRFSDTEIPDIAALMAQIRSRIEKDIEGTRDRGVPFQPHSAEMPNEVKAGKLVFAEELRYLNLHYGYSSRFDLSSIQSHRAGIVGRTIVRLKRKLLSVIWESLFKNYFDSERDFQSNLVRYLNEVGKYVDGRDAANFWQLVRKIDVDVARCLERVDSVHDEQNGELRSTERRLTAQMQQQMNALRALLEQNTAKIAAHDSQLRTLDSVARGLEGIVASFHGAVADKELSQPSQGENAESHTRAKATDFSYLLLENRYRGSEAEISARLEPYAEFFAGSVQPILEIGSGRGELQGIFRKAGAPSYGIDMDRGMNDVAIAHGFDCRLGDGLEHLAQCADRSLGGVIAIQVAEHLTREQIQRLLALCAKKVVSSGKVILETINPRSLVALSSNYFRDPTHVWPLHPDTLGYAMTLAGLEVAEVRGLSPIPPEAQLKPIDAEPYMSPRWVHFVDRLNANIKQLNDLVYGYQDYCIVGVVR